MNWSTTAIRHAFSFCCTAWLSHMCPYIPSSWASPPPFCHPTLLYPLFNVRGPREPRLLSLFTWHSWHTHTRATWGNLTYVPGLMITYIYSSPGSSSSFRPVCSRFPTGWPKDPSDTTKLRTVPMILPQTWTSSGALVLENGTTTYPHMQTNRQLSHALLCHSTTRLDVHCTVLGQKALLSPAWLAAGPSDLLCL